MPGPFPDLQNQILWVGPESAFWQATWAIFKHNKAWDSLTIMVEFSSFLSQRKVSQIWPYLPPSLIPTHPRPLTVPSLFNSFGPLLTWSFILEFPHLSGKSTCGIPIKQSLLPCQVHPQSWTETITPCTHITYVMAPDTLLQLVYLSVFFSDLWAA